MDPKMFKTIQPSVPAVLPAVTSATNEHWVRGPKIKGSVQVSMEEDRLRESLSGAPKNAKAIIDVIDRYFGVAAQTTPTTSLKPFRDVSTQEICMVQPSKMYTMVPGLAA